MTVHLTLDNEVLAKTYDEISDSQFHNGSTLVGELEVKSGATVLDIGCGTGRLGRYVVEIIGTSGSLIGIDPLAERIRIANEKNEHSNAVYKIGSAEDLGSIADNSIDVAYLSAVFHWVTDKVTALREIFRVLKPGGRVGITTGAKELNSFSEIQQITDSVLKREPYAAVVKTEDATLKKHGLTATELIQLLTQAGFTVENIQVKKITGSHATAEDLIKHHEASSFGNYLSHVPESLREQAKADIESEINKGRTKDGIQFDRHTIFAIAQKRSEHG